MKILFSYLIMLSPLIFLACEDNKTCAYKPSPIFQEDLPHIEQYKYEESGVQSLESIWLDRGMLLEVYQEVCNTSRQEYRFTVPGPTDDFRAWADSLWFKEASRQLVFLSSLSQKQAPLKSWGDVIEQARPMMKLAEPFEVEQGVFVKVDKVLAEDQTTLLVELYQE